MDDLPFVHEEKNKTAYAQFCLGVEHTELRAWSSRVCTQRKACAWELFLKIIIAHFDERGKRQWGRGGGKMGSAVGGALRQKTRCERMRTAVGGALRQKTQWAAAGSARPAPPAKEPPAENAGAK